MKRWLTVLLFCSLVPAQEPNHSRAAEAQIVVLHRTVLVDGAPYPATITRPQAEVRFPAVFLIGGLGCYSLENIAPDDPYAQLLDGLTRAGFVTMRVDKIPQKVEGDKNQKQGPPCDS